MPTTTRKQREIAQREQLILKTARAMLAEHGYHGLNMDRLASAVDYAKGTIYLHFASKEDLIAALCTDTAAVRAGMFRRAAAFDGRTRERITAVAIADELFVQRYPSHFAVENLLDIESVFDRVSPPRRDAFLAVKEDMLGSLLGIVDDAVHAGDLALPEGVDRCEPIYALWIQAAGHYRINGNGPLPPPFDRVDPVAVLWKNRARILDAYGWQPLSAHHDEAATRRRIRDELFADDPSPALETA